MRAIEFLGGEAAGDGLWDFTIGRELHGAFGGAFGGALTACTVLAARSLVGGRVPSALDVRFLRGLGAGTARITPTLIHEGRSLSCVSVDVVDARGKLTTRATISFVDPAILHPLDDEGSAGSWKPSRDDGGVPWQQPPGVEVPIVTSLRPRAVGLDERGIATALAIPWDEDVSGASAEAACLAADICVGPPVAQACTSGWIPHPNPDLSLRFLGSVVGDEVVGIGRLERMDHGLAGVRIEVRSGERLVAIGVSDSMLLDLEPPDARKAAPAERS